MMTLYLNQEHNWCMSLLHKIQEKGRENRKSLFSSLTAAEVTEVGCELISMYLLPHTCRGAGCLEVFEGVVQAMCWDLQVWM